MEFPELYSNGAVFHCHGPLLPTLQLLWKHIYPLLPTFLTLLLKLLVRYGFPFREERGGALCVYFFN